MNFKHTLAFMAVGSFIFQYIGMSTITTNSYMNIRNSVGKMYLSAIMAIFMMLLEVFMHDMSYHTIHSYYYIILIGSFSILVVLYRRQIGINDIQYLNEMIEHHSMALLTSRQTLKKSSNYQVRKLANQIEQNQQIEIKQMNEIKKQIK
jgi:hypothetical protein